MTSETRSASVAPGEVGCPTISTMTVTRRSSRDLDDITAAADALEAAIDRRAEAIITAREKHGHTWREVADAARMTPNGARLTINTYRKRNPLQDNATRDA